MCVCSKSAEKLFMDFGKKALSPFLGDYEIFGGLFIYIQGSVGKSVRMTRKRQKLKISFSSTITF